MAFIVVPGRNETLGEILVPRLAAGMVRPDPGAAGQDDAELPKKKNEYQDATSSFANFARSVF
jgi:hypothetical protein